MGLARRRFIHNECGSVTLEAGLLLPVITLAVLGMLLFSIYSWQKVLLYGEAHRSAERAAYVWDNSFKDPVTGAFSADHLDGMYAGISVEDWSGMIGFGELTETTWRTSGPGLPQTLSERKLYRSSAALPVRAQGEWEYSRSGLDSGVELRLQRPLRLSIPFLGIIERVKEEGVSYVINPAEWIRSIDLVVHYAQRMKAYHALKAAEQVNPAVPFVEPDPEPAVVIRSEAEASAYIRRLVKGLSTNLDTSETGRYRHIDAIDADGVAHEAKYTVNVADAKDQLLKDVELMRSGAVKGVMWHFFRNQRTGKVDLSVSLRKQLEKNGIIVIIHN